jgi:hypothetical protein
MACIEQTTPFRSEAEAFVFLFELGYATAGVEKT